MGCWFRDISFTRYSELRLWTDLVVQKYHIRRRHDPYTNKPHLSIIGDREETLPLPFTFSFQLLYQVGRMDMVECQHSNRLGKKGMGRPLNLTDGGTY